MFNTIHNKTKQAILMQFKTLLSQCYTLYQTTSKRSNTSKQASK